MSSRLIAGTAMALERLLGRRLLWRLGRSLYFHARRDASNDPALNGEYALQRTLARLARKNKKPLTIIDVGANTGYWSLHLLEICRDAGVDMVRLWAFEPSEEIRERLEARMKDAPAPYLITIRPEAVAAKSGEAAFDGTPGLSGTKSLLTRSMIANEIKPRVQIAVTTLEDVFVDEGIQEINYVKVDVEGYDLDVVRGALPLLAAQRIGLLQFEYSHHWVMTHSFLQDVFELAEDVPYRVCKIVPDGIESYQGWHPELETFIVANFALVRDDLVEELGVREGWFDVNNTFDAP